MAAPFRTPSSPDPLPRARRRLPRTSAEQSLLGLGGLFLGGWGLLTAVMADSDAGLRGRALAVLILVCGVCYLVVRLVHRWPTGPRGMITGVLVGSLLGWLVASSVIAVGPSLILPLGLSVAGVAGIAYLVRSVRRASAVVAQTVAELAANNPAAPSAEPDSRTRVQR